MTKEVKIMVSCGSGIATSIHVTEILREYLADNNLRASINTCSVNDLPNRLSGVDLIVSSAQVPFETGVPVFNAVALLTGVGEEELLAKIADKVRQLT